MSAPRTTVTADPYVPAVRIQREFDAPRAAVFDAHVRADLAVQWLGPHGMTMTIDTWRCSTGGCYRYTHRRGAEEYVFFGSFHEVRAPERIVQTFTYEGVPDGVALETLTLDAVGGRTRLSVVSIVESFEARDAFIASGMEVGVRESYERLDALLEV